MCRNLAIATITMMIAASPIFAIGTVTQSLNTNGAQNWVLAINWTGDATTGTVPSTLTQSVQIIQGYRVFAVEVAPGSPAPTNNYNITLTTFLGVDVLSGGGGSLSNTTASALQVPATAPPVNGALTFNLSGNSVAGAKGNVLVYFAPIAQVTGLLAPTGPSLTGSNLFSGTNSFTGPLVMTGTDSGNQTITGNKTITGTTVTTQLNGCQYVDASQTFAQALAAVSNPGCIQITPGTYTVGANATIPAGVTLVDTSGGILSIGNTFTLTINGPIVAPAQQLFTYTGTGVVALGGGATVGGITVTWFPGVDIGAQINAAYAASPAASLTRLIVPPTATGACYNYTTGILFTTSNKYPILQGPGGGSNGASTLSNCLNYTPTTGIAIEMGYVATNSVIFSSQHGIRDLTLQNNGCVTSGGCGGSAFGIDSQNVGWGNSNAFMENVTIVGFPFAYNNSNLQNVPGVTWVNPLWEFNGVAWTNGNNTNNFVFGGTCTGNTTCVQATTTTGGEYTFVNFAAGCCNAGPTFDFTRATTKVTATFTGVHFEDGPTASATTPHFISGLCSCRIYGGEMESDQTTGTQDWFISIAAGGALEIHGLDLLSGGKTFTQVVLLNTTARANAQISNFNTAAFPTILGGAGASQSIVGNVAANTTASMQLPAGTFPEIAAPAGIAAANIDGCYGDSTAHSLKCSYNNGSFFGVPLIGIANTWSANQSFNSGTLLPSAAGGTDLGSTALPFGNLWLGASSTSQFKLAPAATAAARVVTIPDPGGNSNLSLTPCITSQRTESAADANLLTCAIPAAIGSYRVRFTMATSAANAATLGWTATWTDSGGTAQAPTNLPLFTLGQASSALTQTTSVATDFWGYVDIDVNNAGTSIVVKLTFSGTSFTAKATATVERIN